MPALMYSAVFAAAFNKEIDLIDDTIKVMLATSTYAPNQDTHDYKNDITNEVSGTGYTAGGATLANDTFNYTAGSNLWTYDADDVSWASATFTCRYAVVYDNTPATDATRPLIEYQDFTGDQTVTAGTFTIQWNASGIFTITVS